MVDPTAELDEQNHFCLRILEFEQLHHTGLVEL